MVLINKINHRYFGFTSQNNIANGLGVFKKGDKIICFGDFEVNLANFK